MRIAFVAVAFCACAAQTTPPEPSIEISVPTPPAPVSGGGHTLLVYELNITNSSSQTLLLKRLQVVSDGAAIASYEGGTFNEILQPQGPLAAGRQATAFIWIALDPAAAIPAHLSHRVTVGGLSIPDRSIEGAHITVSIAKPVVVGPPLRGSDWAAANGPSNYSAHRRAVISAGNNRFIAQRFAIDWIKLDAGSAQFTGDPKVNKSYYAYGQEVLAVVDAVVATVKDGIPENVPGLTSRAVPITLETAGGNHIILDLGGGRFAFYAHLQPGSMRVKVGDHVHRGQVLALVGNSGNSTAPHLHFHVSGANSPLLSEGLPYVLDSFEVLYGPLSGTRNNDIPVQNMRVRFTP